MEQDTHSEFRRLMAAATALYENGRLEEAAAAYRAALDTRPGHGVATHNLGVVLAAQGEHQAALRCFDEALAADSAYVSAYYNRAIACIALGRAREAVRSLARTCALEPQHYEAHRALGFLWLSQGERGRALDHFARAYELRRGEDRIAIAATSLGTATRDKLLHDAEQFRHLARRLRNGQRLELLARNYEEVADRIGDAPARLSAQDRDLLGADYNTAIHVRGAPEIAGRAVSPRADVDALTRRFGADQAVYCDDLLTPTALQALRRYLLESTIWHDFSHIGGFVASYLEDGLACPLLLQIVDELRASFPALLGPLPLSQAWAFKGLRPTAAIDAHADDAAISVNFWVTPETANLSPDHGGLVVCRAAPPPDWTMTDYESDRQRVVAFLEQRAESNLVVPYRANRAVVFRARLFHYSDAPNFQSGYENHRINMTLLFGHADG
ncbi:MAG: tetratricopeptide repeat protein [Hyphomicrobiales bacterium]|nr:tetratricopeptide repeat protein [Hyphomicrobiales bacterium]